MSHTHTFSFTNDGATVTINIVIENATSELINESTNAFAELEDTIRSIPGIIINN